MPDEDFLVNFADVMTPKSQWLLITNTNLLLLLHNGGCAWELRTTLISCLALLYRSSHPRTQTDGQAMFET